MFLYIYKLPMNTLILYQLAAKCKVDTTVSKTLPNLPIPASSTVTATFLKIPY